MIKFGCWRPGSDVSGSNFIEKRMHFYLINQHCRRISNLLLRLFVSFVVIVVVETFAPHLK